MLETNAKDTTERYRKLVGRDVANAGRPANTPEVLWSKVEKKGEDDCWPWLGVKNHQGYGRVQIGDWSYYAHRVIFMMIHGRWPEQIDHIDGNNHTHIKSNLRLLCPNCHSQTDTWCGRNK